MICGRILVMIEEVSFRKIPQEGQKHVERHLGGGGGGGGHLLTPDLIKCGSQTSSSAPYPIHSPSSCSQSLELVWGGCGCGRRGRRLGVPLPAEGGLSDVLHVP